MFGVTDMSKRITNIPEYSRISDDETLNANELNTSRAFNFFAGASHN